MSSSFNKNLATFLTEAKEAALNELSRNNPEHKKLADNHAKISANVKNEIPDRYEALLDNLTEDYEWLYEYICGKITKEPAHADKFKRLFDKGYLVTKGDSEYVNMIVCATSNEEFIAALPEMPEEFKALSEEFDEEMHKIEKTQFPAHVQALVRAWTTNSLARNTVKTRVLELLVADCTLKPLTDAQKHSVNTIMFCDTLPESI